MERIIQASQCRRSGDNKLSERVRPSLGPLRLSKSEGEFHGFPRRDRKVDPRAPSDGGRVGYGEHFVSPGTDQREWLRRERSSGKAPARVDRNLERIHYG